MLIDIRGKINNMKLAKRNSLLPLFEAVVNSLQSIEDMENSDESYIKIIIERDLSQQAIDSVKEDGSLYPISNIIIEDNGTGFNDENYRSFQTSDSTYKISKGGKGVGRFLWLKAFESVNVESVYEGVDGKTHYRSFDFNLIDTNNPITNKIDKDIVKKRYTKISLNSFINPYRDSCPKKLETIALKIIEHCISYFILNTCPRITVEDNFESLCLNELFRDQICVNSESESFIVNENEFKITHVKLYVTDDIKNRIHLCANNREVMREDLNKSIKNLVGRIEANGEVFAYSGYVSGRILDENVNLERTGFNLFDNEDVLPGIINIKDIENEAVKMVKKYLSEYIEPINEKKIEKINNYVNMKSPQYKVVLKYKTEKFEDISPKINEKDLEIELFKLSQELNYELKSEGENFLNKKISDFKDLDEYKEEYASFIQKQNDFGKSSLAQYIVHRKVILSLLDNGLELGENSKYKLEEYVHNLIFPMRSLSEDIDYEKHNLWIIDEKLAYHYYLASDIKMKNIEIIGVDSDDRPDILIMDNPVAIVNQEDKPYNSVVIIEFKRPMRNNYDEDDNNPINQVLRYVKKIRSGEEKDKKGRPIIINDNTPFYLYVIADLTPKMVEYAEYGNLTRTPDNLGFFGYYTGKEINAYIEVISYDKLVEDAKKRNKILFDKLFTPQVNVN